MEPESYIEFARKIKAKYPQYADMDDLELAQKIVDKYPQYADQVTFDDVKKKRRYGIIWGSWFFGYSKEEK